MRLVCLRLRLRLRIRIRQQFDVATRIQRLQSYLRRATNKWDKCENCQDNASSLVVAVCNSCSRCFLCIVPQQLLANVERIRIYIYITPSFVDNFLEHVETIHNWQREQNCRDSLGNTFIKPILPLILNSLRCSYLSSCNNKCLSNRSDWLNLFANSCSFRMTTTLRAVVVIAAKTTTATTTTTTTTTLQMISMLVNLCSEAAGRPADKVKLYGEVS